MEKESFFKRNKHLLIYFICCLFCFAVNLLVYTAMTKALKVDLSEVGENGNAVFSLLTGKSGSNLTRLLICTFTSWTANLIAAFITNKIFVFKSHDKSPRVVAKEFLKFFSGHIFTGIIDWFGTPLLVMCGMKARVFGVEGLFAKVTVGIVIMVLNYLIGKLLVFKKRGKNKSTEDIQDGL